MPSWGVFWRHITQQRKICNGLADACLWMCSLLTSAGWRVKCNLIVPQTITFLQLLFNFSTGTHNTPWARSSEFMLSKSPFSPGSKNEAKLQKANTLFASVVTQPAFCFCSNPTHVGILTTDIPYFSNLFNNTQKYGTVEIICRHSIGS